MKFNYIRIDLIDSEEQQAVFVPHASAENSALLPDRYYFLEVKRESYFPRVVAYPLSGETASVLSRFLEFDVLQEIDITSELGTLRVIY